MIRTGRFFVKDMSTSDDHFPVWLTQQLANYSFDWKTSTTTSFPDLLRHITLHDSGWYHTLSSNDNSMLLVIELDAIWNKEFCHQQEIWPYLIIKIRRVINSLNDFTQDDFLGVISDVESLPINTVRFKEWIEFAQVYELLPTDLYRHFPIEQPLHRTEISTVYGGVLSITHESPIQILLYSANGQQLEIDM